MHPIKHVALSSVVSGVFATLSQSFSGTVACFLSGIFIDVDHIMDFCLAKKRFPFKFKDLNSFCAYEKQGKLYLVFHSYELWIVIWVVVLFFDPHIVWLGIAVGATVHLFADQIENPIRPFLMFMTYRILHGFKKEFTYPEEYFKKMK